MIALIAAVAENNVIGKDGKIPWHIPEDLQHFKAITMGHPVIMGRKTFASIVAAIGKPLPGRDNVVISRDKNIEVPREVKVFTSLVEALRYFKGKDVFVIGGEEIYRQTIAQADTLYITHVSQSPEGDTFFPRIEKNIWDLVSEETHDGYRFAVYTRRSVSRTPSGG